MAVSRRFCRGVGQSPFAASAGSAARSAVITERYHPLLDMKSLLRSCAHGRAVRCAMEQFRRMEEFPLPEFAATSLPTRGELGLYPIEGLAGGVTWIAGTGRFAQRLFIGRAGFP